MVFEGILMQILCKPFVIIIQIWTLSSWAGSHVPMPVVCGLWIKRLGFDFRIRNITLVFEYLPRLCNLQIESRIPLYLQVHNSFHQKHV